MILRGRLSPTATVLGKDLFFLGGGLVRFAIMTLLLQRPWAGSHTSGASEVATV